MVLNGPNKPELQDQCNDIFKLRNMHYYSTGTYFFFFKLLMLGQVLIVKLLGTKNEICLISDHCHIILIFRSIFLLVKPKRWTGNSYGKCVQCRTKLLVYRYASQSLDGFIGPLVGIDKPDINTRIFTHKYK